MKVQFFQKVFLAGGSFQVGPGGVSFDTRLQSCQSLLSALKVEEDLQRIWREEREHLIQANF
jgi:hypothetical protein